MPQSQRLSLSFYTREDILKISKELLGKVLVTTFDGQRSSGIIVETEAYRAPEDKASHAYNNRRTNRTDIFYSRGGVAYVYLCYGIHHLFNVITGPKETPHAILIRAVEPLEGIPLMLTRRNHNKLRPQLSAGPGVMSKALGIDRSHTGMSLVSQNNPIWIEERPTLDETQIITTTRIGIDYAEEYANKPWRFYIKDSKWISKK